VHGPSIGDDEALRTEAVAARALGFAAKVCIHPRQLAVVHDVFTPTDEELAWARRVVDAAGEAKGRGAIAVDGQMVDAPVVARARRLLAS